MYREQFLDFNPATMPAIPAEWEDVSWRNDGCPSFRTPSGLRVEVDYADPAKREIDEGGRFTVCRFAPDLESDPEDLFSADDWQTVLVAVRALEAIDAATEARMTGGGPYQSAVERLAAICEELCPGDLALSMQHAPWDTPDAMEEHAGCIVQGKLQQLSI